MSSTSSETKVNTIMKKIDMLYINVFRPQIEAIINEELGVKSTVVQIPKHTTERLVDDEDENNVILPKMLPPRKITNISTHTPSPTHLVDIRTSTTNRSIRQKEIFPDATKPYIIKNYTERIHALVGPFHLTPYASYKNTVLDRSILKPFNSDYGKAWMINKSVAAHYENSLQSVKKALAKHGVEEMTRSQYEDYIRTGTDKEEITKSVLTTPHYVIVPTTTNKYNNKECSKGFVYVVVPGVDVNICVGVQNKKVDFKKFSGLLSVTALDSNTKASLAKNNIRCFNIDDMPLVSAFKKANLYSKISALKSELIDPSCSGESSSYEDTSSEISSETASNEHPKIE